MHKKFFRLTVSITTCNIHKILASFVKYPQRLLRKKNCINKGGNYFQKNQKEFELLIRFWHINNHFQNKILCIPLSVRGDTKLPKMFGIFKNNVTSSKYLQNSGKFHFATTKVEVGGGSRFYRYFDDVTLFWDSQVFWTQFWKQIAISK